MQYRRTPPPIRHLLLLTAIIFLLIIMLSFYLIDRGLKPTLMDIANEKTIEFATSMINSAVKSTERISFDDLVDIQMDNNGNVSTVGWNSDAVNRRSEEHTTE